jgi:hypothetical protein
MAFPSCHDIGADKKTLHCVVKIHFRLFRPTFFRQRLDIRRASAASYTCAERCDRAKNHTGTNNPTRTL